MLSACTSIEKPVQRTENNTPNITIHCKQEWYYNSLSWSQVYHYAYNTGDKTWTVEIPELCVQLSIEDKQYWWWANDTVRDRYRQAGVLREWNRVTQNPLSEDIKNQLIQQYPNEELYLEDMMPTHVQFLSIISWDTITGSIQKIWKTYLPGEECIPTISFSIRDVFVETDNLTQYNGTITNPTENSPIEWCPSIFAYSWENRIIMPWDYPQGTFDFFAPTIQFTDR